MKRVLHVEGMTCAHCQGRVQKALEELKGVEKVAVDLSENTATVEGEGLEDTVLVAAVEEAGYHVNKIETNL